jgi:alpha-L-fucosidase
VGLYFSPEDFLFLRQFGETIRRQGGTGREKDALLAYDKKQLDELLGNYGDIDVIFLDGGADMELAQYVHKLQPKCVVTRGEMETPEQNLPKEPVPGPWESCFTLGNQWQFKPTNEEYKTGSHLIKMLIEIRAKGGNLLINMGPEPSGIMPFEQERIFRELALWMFINNEAIHNVRPCPVAGDGNVWYTQSKDGASVYVFLNEFTEENKWKIGERKTLTLKELRATPKTVISVLSQNDKVVEYKPDIKPDSRFSRRKDGIEISVVRAQRIYNNRSWPNTVVVKLENVEFAAK